VATGAGPEAAEDAAADGEAAGDCAVDPAATEVTGGPSLAPGRVSHHTPTGPTARRRNATSTTTRRLMAFLLSFTGFVSDR
jgi:hypothetical protein